MNILCFIENLNAGGAQRQICSLANLLKENKNDVTILTYHGDNFYIKDLLKDNIRLINLKYENKLLKIFKLIKFLRNSEKDIRLCLSEKSIFDCRDIKTIRGKVETNYF